MKELILGSAAHDAQRRFTSAVETLAKVRKHLAAAALLASRTPPEAQPAERPPLRLAARDR